ncbi:nuclear transport factor 2 family protein [Streptomyces sulphureus]|uniref:nuclear transport factor 2 family protein n=1 Tax=Streptomyces sulphureus TaxID=47758 RepID=UPI00037A6ED5|nr:nuclear transport factor 2 family protein [Streptomyces sulphureus]
MRTTYTPRPSPTELWESWLGIWNGRYANADTLVADAVTVHLPRYGMPDSSSIRTREGLVSWIDAFRSSYSEPSFRTSVGPFKDGATLIGRWRFGGTWQSGRPAGAEAPPGTPVEQHGVDILRLDKEGRIVEYWLSDDLLDVYVQVEAPLPKRRG